MSRMPGAIWDPLAADWASQPRMTGHNFVCVHTMVGSLEGTDDWFRFKNGRGYDGTESHFGTGYDGRIEQWQDIRFQAEANLDGNGDVISTENADVGRGFPVWNLNDGSQVPAFTDDQVEANARILAWACSKEAHADCPPTWLCHQVGIPISLVPDTKPGRRGVAYHRQGIDPWRVAGGTRWSRATGKVCPGDRRIKQLQELIIPRARQIAGGAQPTPGDDMAQVDQKVFDQLVKDVASVRTLLEGKTVNGLSLHSAVREDDDVLRGELESLAVPGLKATLRRFVLYIDRHVYQANREKLPYVIRLLEAIASKAGVDVAAIEKPPAHDAV